jgi:hypothetical protein
MRVLKRGRTNPLSGKFAVFRLGHLPLKTINGEPIAKEKARSAPFAEMAGFLTAQTARFRLQQLPSSSLPFQFRPSAPCALGGSDSGSGGGGGGDMSLPRKRPGTAALRRPATVRERASSSAPPSSHRADVGVASSSRDRGDLLAASATTGSKSSRGGAGLNFEMSHEMAGLIARRAAEEYANDACKRIELAAALNQVWDGIVRQIVVDCFKERGQF